MVIITSIPEACHAPRSWLLARLASISLLLAPCSQLRSPCSLPPLPCSYANFVIIFAIAGGNRANKNAAGSQPAQYRLVLRPLHRRWNSRRTTPGRPRRHKAHLRSRRALPWAGCRLLGRLQATDAGHLGFISRERS